MNASAEAVVPGKPTGLFRLEAVTWTLAGLGVLFRLRQYLFDRSLWLDEALLVLNIIRRSPGELLKPLEYHQGAPLGFLMSEKAAVLGFGSSEAALRLVPFLSGIASMILFVTVSRRFLGPVGRAIAVGLFAISGPLIYYSAEAKQYSSDVLFTTLLLLLAGYVLEHEVRIARAAVVLLVGAIVIWCSQPAAFVLAALGASWLFDAVRRRDRRGVVLLSIASVFWLASFLLYFRVSLRQLTYDSTLMDYWQGAFAPFPPKSLADLRWLIDSVFGVFADPVGLTLAGIAAATAVAGLVCYYSEFRARFILFLTPTVLALAASALHRYPFSGRLLLFLVPCLVVLIAAGLESVHVRTRNVMPLLSLLLIGFLLLHPLLDASASLIRPRTKEEIKPVIGYVETHRQTVDVLYLYYGSLKPFDYYSARRVITPIEEIKGIESRKDWALYRKDLDKLRGQKRAWILFSHVYRGGGTDEERLFLDYLDVIGVRLDSFHAPGASVYLYDLSSGRS